MKVLVLCALVAVASAGVVAPAYLETGASTQHRNEDGLGNYGFGYDETHTTGGTFRKEHGDAFGNKAGSYGLVDADGRRRVVSYVADALGFRANIQTNEPGVDPARDPAAVLINKAGVAVAAAAPIAAYAAPIAAAPLLAHRAIAAPVLAHRAIAAPIAVAAPVALAHSYSTNVNHGVAAPLAVAAPVLAHRAIGVAAPIAHGIAHGGVIAHRAIAAPLGIAHRAFAAPAVGIAHGVGAYGAFGGVGAYGAGVGAYGAGIGHYGAGLGHYKAHLKAF